MEGSGRPRDACGCAVRARSGGERSLPPSLAFGRYAREERRYKQENQDLTEEYKRITEQFKDLQNKFQHFEVADTNRYRDVWQMNEEAITELMRKARLRAAPARRALGAAIRVAPPP